MKPNLSYVIWFSQRTGSSVLCRALQDTGIAGRPQELLLHDRAEDLMAAFGARDAASLQRELWREGSTPNGVFGLKVSFYEPHHSVITDVFQRFPGCMPGNLSGVAVWHNAFPNCKHVVMTRRNRVRLAVSWWMGIQSGDWHHPVADHKARDTRSCEYRFAAIRHLLLEADLREAGIQAFLDAAGIVPLTVVYEDLSADFAGTVRRVLDFLQIPGRERIEIPMPHYEKLADDLSEEWVQRFRRELQAEWPNKGW